MDTSKLAVVYVRVSTKLQVDNYSVQDQRKLGYLAARYGFNHVEVREEQGASAETITARPIMKRILEEIDQGIIGAIIVASFTRLTRDIDDIDGKIIKKICRDEDCVIITPEKLYDFSNDNDDDMADMQFLFSKIQKRMNLKPMIRGIYTKVKSGGFVGVPLSFGYDYTWQEEDTPKGRRYMADLVINPEEAAVVRYIHDRVPDMLYRQLANHLNNLVDAGTMMPYPIKHRRSWTPAEVESRPWTHVDVRNITVNDLYIGRLTYAFNVKSAMLRGVDPVVNYRDDLRILPDDIWERNQRIIEARRWMAPRSKAFPSIYGGLLSCPKCGGRVAGRDQRRRNRPDYSYRVYQCSSYIRFGTRACSGYFLPERCITEVILPILIELIQVNLRDYLNQAAKGDTLSSSLEGELKAELAKVNQAMKNLVEAVKAGALSLDLVREENAQLQESKARIEKRISQLSDTTRMTDELRAIIEVFDTDLDRVLVDLMQNRLRFNTFIRLFLASITIEVDPPGKGWIRGLQRKEKGELAPWNPRLTQFTLEPKFQAFVEQTGLRLPQPLLNLTQSDYPTENNASAFIK